MNILEARRRTLGKGVYKNTVEGNPAIAQGSLARMYPGITMQGWTEQDSTTGAQLLDLSNVADINNTTHELTDTGLTVTGLYYVTCITDVKPNTDMYISYEKSGDGVSQVSIYNSSGLASEDRIASYGTMGGTFNTGDNSQINVLFYSGYGSSSSSTYNNVMLNEGTSAKPYEPYTGGAPSPSPDYPQEIVSAGNWNEAAQKWEYEIEVSGNDGFSQTVTLTSDRPLTKWDKLEKRNGQWGWVYKSAEIVCDGSETWFLTGVTSDEYQGFALKSSDYNAMNSNLRLVCDKFAYSTSDKINTCRQEKSEYGLRFVVSTEYVPNKTVAEFKNWLQSNPITVLYRLAEPVFVPLTESEQNQMNSLHTNRPTTVLSNDAGCEMTLTYKTKKSLEVTT